jgi:NAD-dependent deacetylase
MKDDDFCDEFLSCQCCAVPQRLRPDIVWFGEMPMQMEAIYSAVEKSDLFIVVGSSGHVYPAAGLVNVANAAGATTILVNLEAPLNAEDFDEVHLGKAGELLPNILEALS